MRTFLVFLLMAVPKLAAAQQPVRDALQRQIVERLIENFRVQGGLTDDQAARFRTTFQRQFRERREDEMKARELVQALESQLRPGVAANVDSLTVLLSAISGHRRAQADRENRFQEEYGTFLSPVQQAQLVLTLERFQRQVENLLRRRQGLNRPGD